MEKWTNQGRMLKAVLKALLFSYVLTAVILLGLAFVLLKFQPDVQKTGIAILVCYVVSCFLGGWICGRKAGKRKFLWGLLMGSVYFALLFLVSGMGERTVPMNMTQVITAFALCAGSGMAGGMVS